MNLPAANRDHLLDEAGNLIDVLLEDGIAPSTVRRWLNQALKDRRSADVIEGANSRQGFRVADTWDYASDLQDAVRELLAQGVSSRSVNSFLNRRIPRTTAQLAKLARKLAPPVNPRELSPVHPGPKSAQGRGFRPFGGWLA